MSKPHVFWCSRGYRSTADCTCVTPLRKCKCGHDESFHYKGAGSCQECRCVEFKRPYLPVDPVVVVDPVTRKKAVR